MRVQVWGSVVHMLRWLLAYATSDLVVLFVLVVIFVVILVVVIPFLIVVLSFLVTVLLSFPLVLLFVHINFIFYSHFSHFITCFVNKRV